MKNNFIQLHTKDGLTLSGIFCEAPKSSRAIIYLHGNGSSSIFNAENNKQTLAESFANNNISFLQFNNRGAEYITELSVTTKKKTVVKRFGMSYEIIRECIYDIDAAIAFLEIKGYKEIYLLGESTGANKICVYNFYKPKNIVTKYMLVSGGDDTGIYFEALGKKQFFALLKKSKEMIKNTNGEDIVTELLSHKKVPCSIFSYKAFYDTCNPDGDYNVFPFYEKTHNVVLSTKQLFRYYVAIQKPTLVVYGENDEYTNVSQVVPILKNEKPEFTYEVIKNADHSFSSHQKELARKIITWL